MNFELQKILDKSWRCSRAHATWDGRARFGISPASGSMTFQSAASHPINSNFGSRPNPAETSMRCGGCQWRTENGSVGYAADLLLERSKVKDAGLTLNGAKLVGEVVQYEGHVSTQVE